MFLISRAIFISILMSFFFIALSCKNKSDVTKPRQSNKEQDDNSMTEKISVDKIKKIRLKKAVELYGASISQNSFIINNSLSEFRIELYNIYNNEQFLNQKINIKEATWAFNKNNNITVWYEKKDENRWMPVHYLLWDKQTEF